MTVPVAGRGCLRRKYFPQDEGGPFPCFILPEILDGGTRAPGRGAGTGAR
jgi:hypothetical protein